MAAAEEPPSSAGAGFGDGVAAGELRPIGAFVRVKPLDADKGGGTASSKRLASWENGRVEVEIGGAGAKVFDYPTATLSPDSSQAEVYDAVAAPLVSSFMEGFDVDMICYGQVSDS